jgi:hypothetical protein
MTCDHVLGLIDAGPFADYPRAHLEVAWDHARQCATCGPALAAATALTTDLAALPQPLPPVDLTAVVLARIAQAEEQRQMGVASPLPESRGLFAAFDPSAWLTALGGVAAGLVIVLSMPPGSSAVIDFTSPKIGGVMTGVVTLPSTTVGALALVASLALYVAGLFAPLGRRAGEGGPRRPAPRKQI